MRIQDLLKFSFELIAPERFASGVRRASADELSGQTEVIGSDQTASPGRARLIIEELDHAEFGGPSFGPHTMELMVKVLEDIAAEMTDRASDEMLREIASAILTVAAGGERDAKRLKAKARAALTASHPSDF